MTKAKDWTEVPLAISREQAAHRLGLGLRTVDRLIASGELKALRVPGRGRNARRILVAIAECARYLATLADQQEEEANGDEAGASEPRPAASTGRDGQGQGRGNGVQRASRRT